MLLKSSYMNSETMIYYTYCFYGRVTGSHSVGRPQTLLESGTGESRLPQDFMRTSSVRQPGTIGVLSAWSPFVHVFPYGV